MAKTNSITGEQLLHLITFSILIDGRQISASVGVLSIAVHKEVNRIPFAVVVLTDGDSAEQDFPLSNEEFFIPGKAITISAGYGSQNAPVFKGIIIKHAIKINADGRSTLSIECKAAAVKMTVGRKSRYFYDSKDSEVFETLLADYSLDADIGNTATTHAELVQYHCTDWDFMLNRAEVNGKICLVENDKIKITDPDFNQKPKFKLTYGQSIFEFEAEMDARFQHAEVKSKAWDYASQEVVETVATNPAITENGNIPAAQLSEVIGLDSFSMQHGGKADSQELQAWANAKLLRNRMAKVHGRVKCQGTALAAPGNLIELEGVGNRFNGNVFVNAVQHQIAEGDWITEIQFGFNPEWFSRKFDLSHADASGLFPAVKGLQVALVTQLEQDPDGEHRILIRLPLISPDEQGIWARVASLDAGDNRGAYFRPEIGDEVIVGFINNDPGEAIVLGMLHSSAKSAPITASDENHEKGFVTRSQMKLLFNDDKKSVLIETPNGNKIQLSEEEGSIKFEDENRNKITMDSKGISLESPGDISIKAGKNLNIESANLNLKADAQFKAQGGAGAEISAGGTTVVKGAIVQIN